VRRVTPLHAGLAQPARPSARAVLRSEHPLVRVQGALKAVVWQSLAIACLLAAGLIALAGGAVWLR
jgi:hypothetical protein